MARERTHRANRKPQPGATAKSPALPPAKKLVSPHRPEGKPKLQPVSDDPGPRGRVDKCLICHWTGGSPEIWGPGREQQWATPQHDLCTRPECVSEYNRRARAGTL